MKSKHFLTKYMMVTTLFCTFFIMPLHLLAQKGEMPITTSSKEALKLFSAGVDKMENIERAAAVILFDQAIEKDPEFALAYLYRAHAGGGSKVFHQNLDKAVSLIDKVTEGEKYFIWYWKAQADDDGVKQKEYLEQLLKLFPSDKRIQRYAGNYYHYNVADYKTALQYYKEAIALDKNYAAIYNYMGYAQALSGDYDAAEKSFKTYINLLPDRPNPYDSYAELLLKLGKYNESIEQYKKAFQKDTLFTTALTGVGDNYVFKKDYETARKYYQKVFDKAPNINSKFGALFSKTTSYVHEGRIEDALKTLDEYRALADKENLAYNKILSYAYKGYIVTELGNAKEGMRHYQQGIDLLNEVELPESSKEYFKVASMMWRAHFLMENNNLDGAKDEIKKCKEKLESRQIPDEIKALNGMAARLEIKKGNYDKALEFFAKSDTKSPLNMYYMAVTYDKKGEKDKASELFENLKNWNQNSLGFALVRKQAMEKIKY